MSVIGYDGILFRVGDRVELHPSAALSKEGGRYAEVIGIVPAGEALKSKIGQNRVRVKVEGMNGVHAGPPQAFRLHYE